MRVNNIGPTNFGAGVRIIDAENRDCEFLYNKLEDIRVKYKIPANFKTHEVELPSVTRSICASLKKMGIKYCSKKI